MMKKLLVFILLLGVIIAGIGYLVVQDQDFQKQKAFIETLKLFAKQAKPLEKQFRSKKGLKPSKKTLKLQLQTADGPIKVLIQMQVRAKSVLLTYAGESDLAGQTVILEPVISQQKVGWKCLNGSLLTRYRTKDCRLGYAIDLAKIESERPFF